MFSQVAEYVGKHYKENISLNDAAAQIGFNPTYFSSLFKQYYGMNFVEYMTNIRIKAAKELLVGTNTKISTIPGLIGLSDLSHFSKSFKAATGYSPSEYKKIWKAVIIMESINNFSQQLLSVCFSLRKSHTAERIHKLHILYFLR